LERLTQTDFCPYTSYLEAALKKRRKDVIKGGEESIPAIEIINEGYRGWTSYALMHGSQKYPKINVDTMLKKYINWKGGKSSFVDMVIIMAGTNDIFQGNYEEYNVSESVISMHQLALGNRMVPTTIALDIPGSHAFMTNAVMGKEAHTLSESLQTYAKSEPRTTFVTFPFPYKDGDEKWSKDRIHCTETGYKVLGESLAPIVEQALQAAGLW